MRWAIPGLVALSIGLCFSGCQKTDHIQSPFNKGTKINAAGEQLFVTYCASCHLAAGTENEPNEQIKSSPTLKNENAFRALLRHPSSSMMPAFDEKTIDDSSVHALYDYLKTHATSH